MKSDRVSIKIVKDPNGTKDDDTFTIKLRVTYKGNRRYYATSHNLKESEWEALNNENLKGKSKTLKNNLISIELEAEKLVANINPFSFNEFEQAFFKTPIVDFSLKDLFNNKIEQLSKNSQLKSASSYRVAIASLIKFKKNISVEDITVNFLKDYEKWMIDNEKSKATIGIYLRNLRSIMNIALYEKMINKENYPFGSKKYIIPVGQNIKKALDLQSIKKIFDYKCLENSNKRMAKDFWIFSYLCNGMNIKDIAYLKWKNLTKETIVFERQKTKNTNRGKDTKITAVRNEKINVIIERWKNSTVAPEEYVFKIIEKGDNNILIERKVEQFIQVINSWMKKIGVELKFELALTTYVARHSFATILVQGGAPLELASQSLGHTNITTTQRYFAGFDIDAQKRYNEALMDF